MKTSVKLIQFTGKTMKNGTHPIMVRVIHNRKPKYTSTGYTCKVSQWNEKSESFRASFPNAEIANREILKLKAEQTITVSKNVVDENKSTDIHALVGKEKHTRTKTPYLLEFAEELIKRTRGAGKMKTASGYNTVKNAIAKFHGGDIRFADIDAKFLNRFEEGYKSRNAKGTTLYCMMKTLRAIWNKARVEGHCSREHYPFKDIKFSYNLKTFRKTLTKDQMQYLRDFDVSTSKQINKRENFVDAKNYFLFSFYGVGINFVDIANLRWSNVKNDRLKFRRQKTDTLIDLSITKEMKPILDFYKMKDNQLDSYIFPILKEKHIEARTRNNTIQHASREVNRNIKLIAKEAGIPNSEDIVFYSARHSWANIQRTRGRALDTISALMGHADLSTTQIYLQGLSTEVKDAANEGLLD